MLQNVNRVPFHSHLAYSCCLHLFNRFCQGSNLYTTDVKYVCRLFFFRFRRNIGLLKTFWLPLLFFTVTITGCVVVFKVLTISENLQNYRVENYLIKKIVVCLDCDLYTVQAFSNLSSKSKLKNIFYNTSGVKFQID